MITAHIFRCGQCQSPSPQKGARAKFVLGLRVRVCAKCAAAPARVKKEAPSLLTQSGEP